MYTDVYQSWKKLKKHLMVYNLIWYKKVITLWLFFVRLSRTQINTLPVLISNDWNLETVWIIVIKMKHNLWFAVSSYPKNWTFHASAEIRRILEWSMDHREWLCITYCKTILWWDKMWFEWVNIFKIPLIPTSQNSSHTSEFYL